MRTTPNFQAHLSARVRGQTHRRRCRATPLRVTLAAAVLACSPALTSCSVTKPVQDEATRHLLGPVLPPASQERAEPRIGVARPTLPHYLDRMQLVTRTTENQIEIHNQRLWAGPLDANMASTLASNLRRLTRSSNVQTADSFVTADYTSLLEVRIHKFDPDASGMLVLECDWRLQPLAGGDVDPIPFRTAVPVAPGGSPMSGRLAAMDEALAQLARTVVRAL
jgi:uncharacterized protein